MSSDFGKNKRRVDIKLNCSTGYSTWIQVLEAIERGETVIKTTKLSSKLPASVYKDNKCIKVGVYDSFLCRALRTMGIHDIRYGTMHYSLGGEGYTIYKPA